MTDSRTEREAFEDHIRRLNPKTIFVEKWADGTYKHQEIQSMWTGWQARAAIAKAEDAQAQGKEKG